MKRDETPHARRLRLSKYGGWVAVDLDATLAEYRWNFVTGEIGEPIPKMVERVKTWLADGIDVRIFTARACDPTQVPSIVAWCAKHIGRELTVTNVKDFKMIELWDDRAIQVIANTGERADQVNE